MNNKIQSLVMTRPDRHTIQLIGVMLLALVLRVISLGDHSLWYDEAFSVLFAQNDLSTMLSGTVGAVEHPLGYYLTLNAWMTIAGQSTTAVRLWSVITGVFSVGVMYLLARHLFDKRTGLIAALILTVAPFHVQYSQETRMYSLMGLLLLSATYIYVRTASDDTESMRWRNWVLVGVLGGLAMHTQQLALFYLLSLGLLPLVRQQWRIFRGMLLAGAIALLLYLPWGLLVIAQLQQLNRAYWIQSPDALAPFLSLRIFLSGGLEVGSVSSLILFVGSVLVTLFVIIQTELYIHRHRHRAKSDAGGLIVVSWLLLAPMGFMWLASQAIPVYLERALLPSALMLYLLLAWFFTRSNAPQMVRVLLGSVCIVLVSIGLIAQYQLDTFPYSPVDDAMQTIKEQYKPDDGIVHMNKLTRLPAEVYAPELPQTFLADPEDSPVDTLAPQTQDVLGVRESVCMAQAVDGAARVWFITLQRAEDEYSNLDNSSLAQVQAWLKRYYTLEHEIIFNDLNVYRYDRTADQIPEDCL